MRQTPSRQHKKASLNSTSSLSVKLNFLRRQGLINANKFVFAAHLQLLFLNICFLLTSTWKRSKQHNAHTACIFSSVTGRCWLPALTNISVVKKKWIIFLMGGWSQLDQASYHSWIYFAKILPTSEALSYISHSILSAAENDVWHSKQSTWKVLK